MPDDAHANTPGSSRAQEPHPAEKPERVATAFRPHAAVLAWLLPGLGHVALGQTRRGIVIGVGVLGLFFAGVLIGGIDSIDSREDRLWFLGQACCGPIALVLDRVHQGQFKVTSAGALRSAAPGEGRTADGGVRPLDPADPADRPPNVKGIGKVNELGTLFSTLAGFMNVIVILDALFPPVTRLRGRGAAGGSGGSA